MKTATSKLEVREKPVKPLYSRGNILMSRNSDLTMLVERHNGTKVKSINGKIAMWVLVDIGAKSVDRVIALLATGQHIEDNELSESIYIDTVTTHSNIMVWHIYISKES